MEKAQWVVGRLMQFPKKYQVTHLRHRWFISNLFTQVLPIEVEVRTPHINNSGHVMQYVGFEEDF